MILTNEQVLALHKHIGYGPIDVAPVIIFGNEPGTAGDSANLEQGMHNLMERFKTRKLLKIGQGFTMLEIDPPSPTSTFLQFIARLMLGLKYNEERFFDTLSNEGRVFLNNYIMNELNRTDTALINLRPFPQSTERHWYYDNISEQEYQKLYNFSLYSTVNNGYLNLRMEIMKKAFELVSSSLILGIGDKDNKKAFLKIIYPDIKFSEILLGETLKIYVSSNPKIILSNYWDNRNIGLSGLKHIYNYIVENNLYSI